MNATEISNRFKIRCSAIGTIMAGRVGLTEVQEAELKNLQDRQNDPEQKDLTERMVENMKRLVLMKNNPELPQGAKSYCLEWLKSQPEFYNRRKTYTSKQAEKGLIMEDDSLDLAADLLGYDLLVKNEEHFENDFMTGTPDNIQPTHTLDVKSPWDFSTFPIFEDTLDPKYEWQGQGYMELTGRKEHLVAYCLVDTPIHLIEKEAYYYSLDNGYPDTDEDIYQKFERQMTYSDVAKENRLKTYWAKHDPKAIKEIENRVILCRAFLKEFITNLMAKRNEKE